LLLHNDGYTDDDDNPTPTRNFKKARKVVVPDPVTSVAARVRQPTAVQKHDAEKDKQAAKEVERIAKADTKVKKAAECQEKAQAKEVERERKAEERRERAKAKAAKDLEKKAKKAEVNARAADSHPSALTDEANASGKDDNGEHETTDRSKDKPTVATGSKVSGCSNLEPIIWLMMLISSIFRKRK
jgi:hypothetical protein